MVLQKKGKKHTGNWLLSKRGYVTCDPHRMPLTIEERTNLQRSTPTREGIRETKFLGKLINR